MDTRDEKQAQLETAVAKGRAGERAPTIRVAYDAYIQSLAWRCCPARLMELERSGGLCRLCGRGRPEVAIEVHHRTYQNLGHERPEDLCTLCSECHGLVTGELRRRRFAGLELPELRDTRRCLPCRTLLYPDAVDA
jgi:hypothetical protein